MLLVFVCVYFSTHVVGVCVCLFQHTCCWCLCVFISAHIFGVYVYLFKHTSLVFICVYFSTEVFGVYACLFQHMFWVFMRVFLSTCFGCLCVFILAHKSLMVVCPYFSTHVFGVYVPLFQHIGVYVSLTVWDHIVCAVSASRLRHISSPRSLVSVCRWQCKLELVDIGEEVDHATAFGRIAFACPRQQVRVCLSPARPTEMPPNFQIKWEFLTPSLLQSVKFVVWKMHRCAGKQYILWSYNTSTFNAMCFDENLSCASAKNKTKRLKSFTFCTFICRFKVTSWRWRGYGLIQLYMLIYFALCFAVSTLICCELKLTMSSWTYIFSLSPKVSKSLQSALSGIVCIM